MVVKTQRQERREIDRTEKAMQRCIPEGHTAEESGSCAKRAG